MNECAFAREGSLGQVARCSPGQTLVGTYINMPGAAPSAKVALVSGSTGITGGHLQQRDDWAAIHTLSRSQQGPQSSKASKVVNHKADLLKGPGEVARALKVANGRGTTLGLLLTHGSVDAAAGRRTLGLNTGMPHSWPCIYISVGPHQLLGLESPPCNCSAGCALRTLHSARGPSASPPCNSLPSPYWRNRQPEWGTSPTSSTAPTFPLRAPARTARPTWAC